MSDGVDITPGAGKTIATDDLTADGTIGGHVQLVKLIDGTDGGNTRTAVGSKGLKIDPQGSSSVIQLASSGLTIATTAYTAGDQLGTEMQFTNAVRSSGSTAVIESAFLTDAAKIIGAVDLYLFNATVTPASDNGANSWSDADILKCLGIISFGTPILSANNSLGMAVSGIPLVIKPAATTLFGYMVTRTGHTFFGAATDIQITLGITQD